MLQDIPLIVDNKFIRLCCKCKTIQLHGKNKRHKDGVANTCKKCRREDQQKYHATGNGKQISKIRRDKLKEDAFNAYGGCICVGCHETEMVVLSIDHIEGGGSIHRKKIKNLNFYTWLKMNNYPEGYRVLCMNCQWRARFGVLILKGNTNG